MCFVDFLAQTLRSPERVLLSPMGPNRYNRSTMANQARSLPQNLPKEPPEGPQEGDKGYLKGPQRRSPGLMSAESWGLRRSPFLLRILGREAESLVTPF